MQHIIGADTFFFKVMFSVWRAVPAPIVRFHLLYLQELGHEWKTIARHLPDFSGLGRVDEDDILEIQEESTGSGETRFRECI